MRQSSLRNIAEREDTVAGFTLVLASLKMWLEFALPGDLIYDTFPDASYADR
jgi:hypothetical protein